MNIMTRVGSAQRIDDVAAALRPFHLWWDHEHQEAHVVTAVAVGLITGVIRQIGESMSLFPVEEVSGVVVSI